MAFGHPNFLFEVFNDDLFAMGGGSFSRQTTREEGHRIHSVIILSAGPNNMHFVGNGAVRVGSKHRSSNILSSVRVLGSTGKPNVLLFDIRRKVCESNKNPLSKNPDIPYGRSHD
jgi:hypothetical protein